MPATVRGNIKNQFFFALLLEVLGANTTGRDHTQDSGTHQANKRTRDTRLQGLTRDQVQWPLQVVRSSSKYANGLFRMAYGAIDKRG